MASLPNSKHIVEHLVNGTFSETICRICLLPFTGTSTSIFTKVCKQNQDFTVVDVLKEVCNIQISQVNNYQICTDCLISAAAAYKFYLQTKTTETILSYYIDSVAINLENIENITETQEYICIKLPEIDFERNNIKGISVQSYYNDDALCFDSCSDSDDEFLFPITKACTETKTNSNQNNLMLKEVIGITGKDGLQKYYKEVNGNLVEVKSNAIGDATKVVKHLNVAGSGEKVKSRRNRPRMTYKSCSKCPVKYRHLRKLKEHMKAEHNIELYICKVCQQTSENTEEYHRHLQTHPKIHTCAICNMVFKKRASIINHLRKHEKMRYLVSKGKAHVCEKCGDFFETKPELDEHYEKEHTKKYKCFYCGKMYKCSVNFESHIKKHDHVMESPAVKDAAPKQKYECQQCNKTFVDARALMWHERLHNNERPYKCDSCDRAFVSLNRRNQHAVSAHTPPARRCPLCPAVFHFTSMVNSHIKQVHLKTNRRRSRSIKRQNVHWKTETVPIEELSLSVQKQLFDLKYGDGNCDDPAADTAAPVVQDISLNF